MTDAAAPAHASLLARVGAPFLVRASVLCVTALIAGAVLVPSVAMGLSATGEAAFRPCTGCHPVTLGADGKSTKPLPIGLEKHEIELEVHDTLGEGSRACGACHDDATRNPGRLLLPDGSLVDIDDDDISRVCQTCHFEKYRDWQVGVHGKREPKCSAAGCHDPHTPSWIYVAALPPFQGTGIEVRAVSEREAFQPMTPPPVHAPVETPSWLGLVTLIGAGISAGALGFVITRGRKR